MDIWNWCSAHLDQAIGLAGLFLTGLGTFIGGIYWASKVYAEVHAMRVGIDNINEFKVAVNKDSDNQWKDLSEHERRIGGLEAGVASVAGRLDIHDREIQHLMDRGTQGGHA